MFTKEEFAHSLEQTYRTSGLQNAGRWFGLVYRSLRLSMFIEPDKDVKDRISQKRQELLATWKEFACRFRKGGDNR